MRHNLAALLLFVAACSGSSDSAGDTAALAEDVALDQEAFIAHRAAFICTNFREEAQVEVGELPAEACEPAAATFMFEHIPYDSFFSPLLARECINAADAVDTYSFWVWCFNAWVT